jgi:hypothetical protein
LSVGAASRPLRFQLDAFVALHQAGIQKVDLGFLDQAARCVAVRVVTHDDYGRTVGKVFDGKKDLGDRMVRDGQAWSSRYNDDRGPYVAEERMAIALKRGLHGAGGAVQPRDFRKQHGPCEGAGPKAPGN